MADAKNTQEWMLETEESIRNLRLLEQHPGWTIFTRELRGRLEQLQAEIVTSTDVSAIALKSRELFLLQSIEHKPTQLADTLLRALETHRKFERNVTSVPAVRR